MKKTEQNLLVALDIGTSKVVAVVAQALSDSRIEILGFGMATSRGMRKGVVVNIDATVQAVQSALDDAEVMAGSRIHSVYVNISGNHIYSFNSHGFVAVKGGEVSADDVARVIEAARAVTVPSEQKILHVLPQDYKVDHQDGIFDPVGMAGIRLEGKIHIVTAAVSAAQNIVNCVRRCGVEVDGIVLGQLASSHAILTKDEQQLGVCLLDIGGGTTDIAVYMDGSLKHTIVLPVGGEQVSNDLAVAFRIPHITADAIKIKYGCAISSLASKDVEITLPGNTQITQVNLAEIIEPRFEEIFLLVAEELDRTGWGGLLGAGIVLTGGSVMMPGVVELAERVFQTHVRLGLPRNVVGSAEITNNPMYASAVGLLLYAQRVDSGLEAPSSRAKITRSVGEVVGQIKNWFVGNF